MIGGVGLLLSLSVLITSILVALQEIATRLSPRQLERYLAAAGGRERPVTTGLCCRQYLSHDGAYS